MPSIPDSSFSKVVADSRPDCGRTSSPPRRRGVDRGKQAVFFAPLAAHGFRPSRFDKRRAFGFGKVEETVRFIYGNAEVLYPFDFIKYTFFKSRVAPISAHIRESIYKPGSFASGILFVGSNNTIKKFLVCSAGRNMLHLNSPPFLDDLVGFCLKLDHRREVCGNCVGRPNFCMRDPCQRKTELFDCPKAGEGIFSVA